MLPPAIFAQVAASPPPALRILNRALVAQPLAGGGEFPVMRNKLIEILLLDREQFCGAWRTDGRGARAAIQQRHFTECVTRSEFRENASAAVDNFNAAFRHDVQRIARISGMEQNFACSKVAIADMGEKFFDVFRRQVSQQVTACQKLNRFGGVLALAFPREFAKARRQADGRAFAFEIDRGHVVKNGADCEAAADDEQRGVDADAAGVKFFCVLIGEFDGERADE